MAETDIKEIIKECEEYQYNQSSNVSRLSRNIIYGIIGTIWILIYDDDTCQDTCIWIRAALVLSCLYLLLDLIHYFVDFLAYRKESYLLSHEVDSCDCCKEDDQLSHKNKTACISRRHKERTLMFSKRSANCLKAKFISILIISVLFLIGVGVQLGIICCTPQ